MTAKPLQDVTVLEMGTFITGPAAGMLLADLGATVIKVEKPGIGDPFRSFKGGLYSPHFQTYNRNKRSITIDPTVPEDLAALDRLVETADVFIQNPSPSAAHEIPENFTHSRRSGRSAPVSRSRTRISAQSEPPLEYW